MYAINKRRFEAVIKCPSCEHEFTKFMHSYGHSYCPKCDSKFSNYRSEEIWQDEIEKYIIGFKMVEVR